MCFSFTCAGIMKSGSQCSVGGRRPCGEMNERGGQAVRQPALVAWGMGIGFTPWAPAGDILGVWHHHDRE